MAKAAKDGALGEDGKGLAKIRVDAARDGPGARLVRGAGVSRLAIAAAPDASRVLPPIPRRLSASADGRHMPMTGACWRCCRRLAASRGRAVASAAAGVVPRRRAAADLAETRATAGRSCRPMAVLLIDGLAYGAMPADLIAPRRARRSSRWCIIRCAWKPGSPRRGSASSSDLETAALALARRVVVDQPDDGAHAGADFAVPADQDHRGRARHRSRPARDRDRRARCSCWPSAPWCRARPTTSSCARSRRCADRDWRLTIAGPTDRSAEALAALQAR